MAHGEVLTNIKWKKQDIEVYILYHLNYVKINIPSETQKEICQNDFSRW